MPALDRFANRYYYETKFMDEELPLWIWETGQSAPSQIYGFAWNHNWFGTITQGERDYSNSLFKPAEWFTMESTPNYFVVDIYGISAGGYSAYHPHKRRYKHYKYKYDDYYASGGSGACIYLANIKIRIKDENLKGVVYQMSGKVGPKNPFGGDYDWSVNPGNVNYNVEDWCIKLAEDAMTPNGVCPAGTIILGMSSGGNATQQNYATPGSGANVFYVPTQCAFPTDINERRQYQLGESYVVGEWIVYNNWLYRVNENFTATSWQLDSRVCTAAANYNDSITFPAGAYLNYNGSWYYVRTQFKGDVGNTILGWADYFLDKSMVSMDIRLAGNTGQRIKDGAHYVPPVPPNRFFKEEDITPLNEIWVRKSLSWGQGQDNGRVARNGQGGGMAMIYKGESS